EIEVDFTDGNVEVDLEAEIELGTLEVEVETERPAADGTFSFDAFEAGTVTFTVSGTSVALVEVAETAGWTFTVDEGEAAEGEVDIEFLNPELFTKVELEAEVDDEDRELEVSVEITIGPG
ncbi:MAG: hypothetical protein ACRDVM_07955, partial [Acidimicrobiia bacterium]